MRLQYVLRGDHMTDMTDRSFKLRSSLWAQRKCNLSLSRKVVNGNLTGAALA